MILGIHHNAIQGTTDLCHLFHSNIHQLRHLVNKEVHKQGILGCRTIQRAGAVDIHVAHTCGTLFHLRFHGIGKLGHGLIGVTAAGQTSAAKGYFCIFAIVTPMSPRKALYIGVISVKTVPV